MRRLSIAFSSVLLFGALASCGGGGEDEAEVAAGAGGTGANRAPLISGTPDSTVVAGSTFGFSPTASDPDGDTLTFNVQGRPSWSSFNTLTGRLQGTPTTNEIGTYGNIRISASDGTATANLPVFSIDVVPIALGTITVTWTAPTEREDGSPLTSIGGFKLYWGTALGDYTNSVLIDNPGITTYVIDNLVPATYYLVATTLDSTGLESGYSDSVSITITAP